MLFRSVAVPITGNLTKLFDFYDKNGNGKLDYKEFSEILFHNKTISRASPVSNKEQPTDSNVEDTLLDIRQKLSDRGIKALTNLGKQFRVLLI